MEGRGGWLVSLRRCAVPRAALELLRSLLVACIARFCGRWRVLITCIARRRGRYLQEAKGSGSLLKNDRDKYWISPCKVLPAYARATHSPVLTYGMRLPGREGQVGSDRAQRAGTNAAVSAYAPPSTDVVRTLLPGLRPYDSHRQL